MGRVNSIFLCFLTLQFWFAETETGSCWIYAAGYYSHWACRGTMGKYFMAERYHHVSVLEGLVQRLGVLLIRSSGCSKSTQRLFSKPVQNGLRSGNHTYLYGNFQFVTSWVLKLTLHNDSVWTDPKRKGNPADTSTSALRQGRTRQEEISAKTPGQHFSGSPSYLLAAETEFGFFFFFQVFSLISQFYERPHVSITVKVCGCGCVCEPKYVAGLMGTCGRP